MGGCGVPHVGTAKPIKEEVAFHSNFGPSWHGAPGLVVALALIMSGQGRKGTRERSPLNSEEFKCRYLKLVDKPESLAYPLDGGRRSDLAVLSKRWIPQDGDLRAYTAAVANSGFLAIHAEMKATSEQRASEGDDSCPWSLKDQQAQSWAKQMTKRLNHLLADVRTAANEKTVPHGCSSVSTS